MGEQMGFDKIFFDTELEHIGNYGTSPVFNR